ncbi:TonB-dependent receptor [Sphingomonas sp. ERG5]|uniref:TonB-dependent receptor n=1 Tax=Sphingomonas sp. ERG5 TaxID=1381597 RepID=UPI00054C77C4|nr:TonB-dependent receptor [Sphingomonas sp. ERG5]
MTKSTLLRSSSLALALSALLPSAVSAQPADSPPVAEKSDNLDDIIVTAQRRSQSAQDVGVALSVLTGDELAKRGVTNVNQLQFQTPSLEVVPAFGGGQPQFRLRGVGFEDYATNNTPTVGVYVDEVAYPVPVMTQGALFDVDRVEVLRGPQGTLYGRNTTGGAINFITRKPTDRLSAGIDAEYGSFNLFKAEGHISGPISDTLKFRLSGVTEQGGAFQHNRVTGDSLGDANRLFGRALLEWTPSAGVDVTLNLHGGRDHSEQTGLYLFQPFQTSGYGVGSGPIIPADPQTGKQTGWGLSPSFAALAGYSADAKPERRNDSIGGSLTAAVDLGSAVRLTSITAYDHLKRRELADWDASSSHESDVFWGSKIDVFSQELRLSSLGDTRLGWVGGVYYSHQKLGEQFLTDFSQSLGFVTDTSYRQTADSISGFGQLNFKLTDVVSLVGGLRYEHETRKLRDFRTAINGTPTFTNGNRDATLDEVSGKAGIEIRPASGLLLYANASRGVKSGGFTVYNSPNANQIDAFKPEILYAYEVGFKADVARSVRINGSAFYYDYRDQQVLGVVINPQRGAIGRIVNAPKSEIYGGELEVEIVPVPRLHFTQSIGYKFGRYRDFFDVDAASVHVDPGSGLYVGNTIDKSGQRLPIANWSYQGSISYAFPIGDRYSLETQADYSFRDNLPSFLGSTFDLPDRWLANATITFRPNNGNWWVGAYGRNIFGEKYDLTRNYFLPNAKVAAPGRPASFGGRVGFNF